MSAGDFNRICVTSRSSSTVLEGVRADPALTQSATATVLHLSVGVVLHSWDTDWLFLRPLLVSTPFQFNRVFLLLMKVYLAVA